MGLDKFLKSRPTISTDDTLALEFTPSMSMEEGNEVPHDDWVSCVAAPFLGQVTDEDIVVTGCYDRRVRLCIGSEVLAVGDGHKGAIKAVAALPAAATDSSSTKRRRRNVPAFTAVTGGKDSTVRIWSYNDGEGLKNVRSLTTLHQESVDALDVSPNGELVVTGSWDKQLSLFKLADALNPAIKSADLQTASMVGHTRPILCCRFSRDNATVLSSGQDGQVKLWDVTRAKFKTTYSGEYAANSLDVHHSDPNLLLTGHSDNRSRVWDSREKRPIKTYSGHMGWVYSAKWAPAGCLGSSSSNLFVTAAEDAAINLYDIRSQVCFALFVCVTDFVFCCWLMYTHSCTSPQRPLATHQVHTDGVLGVCFTQTSTVASCSKDTTVRTTTLTGSDQAAAAEAA